MRIDGRLNTNAAAAAGAAQSRPSGAARFSLGAGSSRGTARAASAAPLATLDAILMLQQEDPGERRRRGARRGQDLLTGLDRLKAGLLAGSIPATELEAMARTLAASDGTTGDPLLDDIVGQIELRVHVELAKLGRKV